MIILPSPTKYFDSLVAEKLVQYVRVEGEIQYDKCDDSRSEFRDP